MKKTVLDEDFLKPIYERYVNGETITSLSQEINIDRHILMRNLKEKGFKMKGRNRRYFLNEDYFENINTENKAYWLGFIAADGCVCKTRNKEESNVLAINLNIRDKKHLEKFAKEIGYSGEIKTIEGRGFGENTLLARLELNSIKLCADLKKLGIVPKKSLILRPPNIPEIFLKDWIRGYLDGDGSIVITKQDIVNIDFCGTIEVLDFIDNFLSLTKEHKKNKRHPESDKNNWQFCIGGRMNAVKVLHKLYDNAEMYLDRKYEKAIEVYSRFEKQFSKL